MLERGSARAAGARTERFCRRVLTRPMHGWFCCDVNHRWNFLFWVCMKKSPGPCEDLGFGCGLRQHYICRKLPSIRRKATQLTRGASRRNYIAPLSFPNKASIQLAIYELMTSFLLLGSRGEMIRLAARKCWRFLRKFLQASQRSR